MYDLVNRSDKTGIHYGAIYANALCEWWPDLIDNPDTLIDSECNHCALNQKKDSELEFDCAECELANHIHARSDNGVEYITTTLGGAILFIIVDSPHTGRYSKCSPCVPNAGDLEEPDSNGILTYDVPPEWKLGADS